MSRSGVANNGSITDVDVNFLNHPSSGGGQFKEPVTDISGGDSTNIDMLSSHKVHYKRSARVTGIADSFGRKLASILSAHSSVTIQSVSANLVIGLKLAFSSTGTLPARIVGGVLRAECLIGCVKALAILALVDSALDLVVTVNILVNFAIAIIITAIASFSAHTGERLAGIDEMAILADKRSSAATITASGFFVNHIISNLTGNTFVVDTRRLPTRVVEGSTVTIDCTGLGTKGVITRVVAATSREVLFPAPVVATLSAVGKFMVSSSPGSFVVIHLQMNGHINGLVTVTGERSCSFHVGVTLLFTKDRELAVGQITYWHLANVNMIFLRSSTSQIKFDMPLGAIKPGRPCSDLGMLSSKDIVRPEEAGVCALLTERVRSEASILFAELKSTVNIVVAVCILEGIDAAALQVA